MSTRREFITLLGGAAAWPIAARAQQSERIRRIGVLMHTAPDEPESQARLAAFMQGLQESGWAVGSNLRIDYRWSVGDIRAPLAKMRRNWSRLPRRSSWAASAPPRRRCNRLAAPCPSSWPQGIDPVGNGYVESLARPGGNITGFIQFEYGLAGKWMEVLKEVAPGVTRVACPARTR